MAANDMLIPAYFYLEAILPVAIPRHEIPAIGLGDSRDRQRSFIEFKYNLGTHE